MKAICRHHGEVEIVERGSPDGLSKIKLQSGAVVTVPTSHLELGDEPEKPADKKKK